MKVKQFSKTKARRVFRSRKRQVDDLTDTASKHIDRHIFRRLTNFADVGRFIIAWLLLVIVLIAGVVYQSRGLSQYYLSTQPTEGGVLSEGIIGAYTNPNPLFASSTVDLSVSRLVFNSILTHNHAGDLVNDLAESIERSEDGLVYDIVLRRGVLWQDGKELTSADILYTYKAIQNPDTRSPYNVSWQGVAIEAPDAYTVKFTLQNALNSFPLSLTNGIVPAHLLQDMPYEELRGASYNAAPIGTGPFRLSDVVRIDDFETIKKRQRIELVRNNTYFKTPSKLDAFVIYALNDEQDLRDYLDTRRIDTAVFNSSPTFQGDKSERYTLSSIPLLAGAYLFFNTSQPPFDSVEMRQAILVGTNTSAVLSSLNYPVQEVNSPLLRSHVGYDLSIVQQPYNLEQSRQILDSLGWVMPEGSAIRSKDGVQLELTITTLQGSDFAKIASTIQHQWATDLGIKVNVITKAPSDLQPLVLQHSYQILLYGISLGEDPDVYAYWHSSQAVIDRFNLSMYKSETADRSLEAGRTRPDITLRAKKYKPFLEAWQKDAPAIGLYQPPLFYVSARKVYNFSPQRLNSAADRFYNVENWEILTKELPILY